MKDYSGIRHGKLVAIRRDYSKTDRVYWIFKCDCGVEISRVPTDVSHQKFAGCKNCRTGVGSHAWKGCGEIPMDAYNTIKHGALDRNLEMKVSIKYLWNLYESQNGLCAFTGLPIYFNKTYKGKNLKTASLDRIDSSKGYVKGNLQWVHRDVNKLKKNFTDSRFLEICKLVASKL